MNDTQRMLLAAGIAGVLEDAAYGLAKVRSIFTVTAKSGEDRKFLLEGINAMFAEMTVSAERSILPRLEADLAVAKAKAKHTAEQEGKS